MIWIALTVACSLVASCTSDEEYGKAEPRPVTREEADRLAVMRYNNYDRHYAEFTMSLMGGQKMWMTGRIDFREHLGYANLLVDGSRNSFALILWDFDRFAAVGARDQDLPAQPPTDAPWQTRSLDVDSAAIDTALVLLLNLAADRPENPLLLQQNGSMWHGSTAVDGTDVEVFTSQGANNGASDRLRYFVDQSGQLRRLVAALPEGEAVIEFGFGTAEAIESPLDEISGTE